MIAIIDVITSTKNQKEEIVNDIMWYDSVDKHLHRFSSGELKYEYVEFITKKGERLEVLVPGMGWIAGKNCVEPQKLYKNAYKKDTNSDAIVKWVSEYGEELRLQVLSMDSREIVVKFPKDKEGESKWRDAVEESLYANRFNYEIQDA
jgi:hypothetical protein